MAMPGEYFFDCPANAYDIGTTAAVPKPTRENPIMAVQKYGKMMASKMPMMMNAALMIYIEAMPILSMITSEINLDKAIKVIKIR